MNAVTAEIEEAVLEANVFGIFGIAEYRQGQFLGFRMNRDFASGYFNEAGWKVLVFGARGTGLHLAVNPYDPFGTDLFRRLEGRRGRVNHNLGQAIMVAQIDEQQAAMIAHPVDPAGKPDVLALVINSELATGVAPVSVRHGRNVPRFARKSAWGQ